MESAKIEDFQYLVKELRVAFHSAPASILAKFLRTIQIARVLMLDHNRKVVEGKHELGIALDNAINIQMPSNIIDLLIELACYSQLIPVSKTLDIFYKLTAVGHIASLKSYILLGKKLLSKTYSPQIIPLYRKAHQSSLKMRGRFFEIMLKNNLCLSSTDPLLSQNILEIEDWTIQCVQFWDAPLITLYIRNLLKAEDYGKLIQRLDVLRMNRYKLEGEDYLNILNHAKTSTELAEYSVKELYWIMKREQCDIDRDVYKAILECCFTCQDYCSFFEILPELGDLNPVYDLSVLQLLKKLDGL